MLMLLYLSVTGTWIQLIDLGALTHATPESPDMQAIREGIDGPGSFAVIDAADFAVAPIPRNYDYRSAFIRILMAAHAAAEAPAAVQYAELRTVDGAVAGLVRMADRTARFDADTGAQLAPPAEPRRGPPPSSAHLTMKNWHRLHSLGDLILALNALVGIGLCVMIVLGFALYWRLLQGRLASGRRGAFWKAGDGWRNLHRGVATVSAIFLLVVAITGTLLAVDSFCLGVYRATHPSMPPGMFADFSSPLLNAEVPGMIEVTLERFQKIHHDLPIKVVRLRHFSGMSQVVIISGGGSQTRQQVFDAASGREVSTTEAGYPFMGFPFGWHEHELVKQMHRGDLFGMGGRWMDLFAGMSLAYLSASGFAMYWDAWSRRRKAGRHGLFWN